MITLWLAAALPPGSECAQNSAPACATLRDVYNDPRFNGLDQASGQSFFSRIAEWINQAIQWFFDHLGKTGSGLLLLVTVLAVTALVLWGVRHLMGNARRREAVSEDVRLLSDDPDIEWREAQAAADRGDHREAVRRGFRSCLLGLAVAGRTRIDASWTTRELLAHVTEDSGLTEELAPAARRFDVAWYSGRSVTAEDWNAARQNFEALRRLASRPRRSAA